MNIFWERASIILKSTYFGDINNLDKHIWGINNIEINIFGEGGINIEINIFGVGDINNIEINIFRGGA